MQSERHQPWQINIHAKAKYVDFKFEAANILPTSKLSPFPVKVKLKVKLSPFIFQAKKSEPQLPSLKKGKSVKSKFLRILGKFRPRPSKNKATAAKQTWNLGYPDAHLAVNQPRHFAFEEPICISSIVIGFIVLLSRSISQKDKKEIILFTLIILLYLASIFKRLITSRTRNVLAFRSVAMLSCGSCAIWVYLSNILKISEDYVSDCVVKALNYAWNYAPLLPR